MLTQFLLLLLGPSTAGGLFNTATDNGDNP